LYGPRGQPGDANSSSRPFAQGEGRQILYSEKEKALFIRTGHGLYREDPEKGAITTSKPFDSFGFKRTIGINPEGDLVLCAEEKFATLDGQFRQNRR